MATINQTNDQENNSPNLTPPTTGGAGGAGTAGGSAAGASAPATNVQQNQAPTSGANFNDVSGYLNANASGSQQLGQAAANNLTNTYNTTKQGIDTSSANTNAQINQGYVPENTQLIQQVAANPTSAAADTNLASGFQSQLNDTYGGPTNWADLGTQQGNVSNAQQQGNLINTQGGTNVLAQQVENQNGQGYSAGINSLDALLLGGNPNAVAQVQAASQPFSGLGDYLNTQNTGIHGNIAAAQTNAQNASQDALNAFTGSNGTLTNLNNTINQNTAQQQSAAQQQQAQLNADLKNLYGGQALQTAASSLQGYGGSANPWVNTTQYNVNQLSPQDLQGLGLSADQGAALYQALQQAGTSQYMTGHNFGAGSGTTQADLSSWLNEQNPTTALTNANTANADQYKEMAAIQQLLGGKNPQGNAINPLNVSQAGTAPTNLNNFDYNTALQQIQGFGTQARTDAQNEANSLTSQADLAHAQSQHQGGLGGFLKNVISHPLQNPIVQYLENPLTALSQIQNPGQTNQAITKINNSLINKLPATTGTNLV